MEESQALREQIKALQKEVTYYRRELGRAKREYEEHLEHCNVRTKDSDNIPKSKKDTCITCGKNKIEVGYYECARCMRNLD
jgi:hypothetical protein